MNLLAKIIFMVFLTIFCVVFVYIAAVEYLTPADEYITAANYSDILAVSKK